MSKKLIHCYISIILTFSMAMALPKMDEVTLSEKNFSNSIIPAPLFFFLFTVMVMALMSYSITLLCPSFIWILSEYTVIFIY